VLNTVKNRHISLQLSNAISTIDKQALLGWFNIDILSDSGNNNSADYQNSLLRLKFSKLDRSKNLKWIFVLKDGKVVNIGEYS
jgi:hypothetical protein